MIFLAVGTQKFPFDRLLKSIDELIDKGKITDEVFAQIGNCTYEPKNYKYKRFLNKQEFENCIGCCSLIITHSGVATIVESIKKNKPVIVMPRLCKYGEHVDDHQVQIAESFQKSNLIFECRENDNLYLLIEKAKTHKFDKYVSQNTKLLNVIRKYLQNI